MQRKTEPEVNDPVLQKIEHFCSYQERCIHDVTEKLKAWSVPAGAIPSILKTLKDEGYIDEERFARIFAGGKFRMKRWGRERIAFELRMKGVSEDLIRKGVEEIDGEDYRRVLKEMIKKKQIELMPGDDFMIREKIINFVHGKGFEYDLILSILKEEKT